MITITFVRTFSFLIRQINCCFWICAFILNIRMSMNVSIQNMNIHIWLSCASALVHGASNKLGEWVIKWLNEWLRNFSPWASSAMEAVNKTKFGWGDEDDAQTSNTCIAQRKRTIPHLMKKTSCNIIEWGSSTRQGALCTSKQMCTCASDLRNDQSRYLLLLLLLLLVLIDTSG